MTHWIFKCYSNHHGNEVNYTPHKFNSYATYVNNDNVNVISKISKALINAKFIPHYQDLNPKNMYFNYQYFNLLY